MGRLFALSVQSNGASASASVHPMNVQDGFPLGWTGLICFSIFFFFLDHPSYHTIKSDLPNKMFSIAYLLKMC